MQFLESRCTSKCLDNLKQFVFSILHQSIYFSFDSNNLPELFLMCISKTLDCLQIEMNEVFYLLYGIAI